MARGPKPNSPVILLHPFPPEETWNESKKGPTPKGLSAEQPTTAKLRKEAYVASQFNSTDKKDDYPEFNWVFEAVIARDPDGTLWVRYWGNECWQRMPTSVPSKRFEYSLGVREPIR